MTYNNALEQIAAEHGKDPELLKLATVTELVNGRAKIKFYGDEAASEKLYPYISSYTAAAGDIVLLIKQASTFVILGKIIA